MARSNLKVDCHFQYWNIWNYIIMTRNNLKQPNQIIKFMTNDQWEIRFQTLTNSIRNDDSVLVIGCLTYFNQLELLKMNIKVKFNFVQGHSLTHYDRQSDIVDYRAAYFAAKKLKKKEFILMDYFPHSCILQKKQGKGMLRKISILFWKKDSTQHSSEPHVKNLTKVKCLKVWFIHKAEMGYWHTCIFCTLFVTMDLLRGKIGAA